jgi:hypothetical protein
LHIAVVPASWPACHWVQASLPSVQKLGDVMMYHDLFDLSFSCTPCTRRFLVQNVTRLEGETGTTFVASDVTSLSERGGLPNVLDSWLLASLRTLTRNVRQEMRAYRWVNTIPNGQPLVVIGFTTSWCTPERLQGSACEALSTYRQHVWACLPM